LSTQSRSEVSTEEISTTEISTNKEHIEVFKRWKELKGQDPIQIFKDGWKPSVRTRKDGYRYIRLRRAKKGSDGKWRTKEKTLGAYDSERWEALLELFPERDKVFPHKPVSPKESMVLSSKVAKPKQMGSHTANIQPYPFLALFPPVPMHAYKGKMLSSSQFPQHQFPKFPSSLNAYNVICKGNNN